MARSNLGLAFGPIFQLVGPLVLTQLAKSTARLLAESRVSG
jgi:hypothetical protein